MPIAGVCRVCGCSDESPCWMEGANSFRDGTDETCRWVDETRTLCSNPECLVKADAGICRVCGCTDGNACVLAPEIIEGDGDTLTCRWVDPSRTLCSNPRCVAEIPIAELEALCSLEPAR